MRKTDISKFSNTGPVQDNSASDTARSIGKILAKALLTLLAILIITGMIVGAFLVSFVWSMKDETMSYDLNKLKLNYTSFIYVYDENGNPVEYQSLYSNENRIWVDYDQIPQAMKDAIVAIEDKRFWEHNGVDWRRTFGAVTQLFSNGSSYGGSTITQPVSYTHLEWKWAAWTISPILFSNILCMHFLRMFRFDCICECV